MLLNSPKRLKESLFAVRKHSRLGVELDLLQRSF
jgi:hypothetical protein